MLQNSFGEIHAPQFIYTFAYRQPDWTNKLQIFEITHPSTANIGFGG